jgi:hypothetical protein
MKTLLITIILSAAFTTSAQTCPPEFAACLSQAQANATAEKLRELKTIKEEEIPALKSQVAAEKQNVLDVKNTAAKNEADLREKNIELLVKVGTLTGQLIGAEASVVRLSAENQFLVPMVRKKCLPFSICF